MSTDAPNAIAGPLFEYLGAEMTTACGSCAHCGASAEIAELRVYARGPGTVVRCRICDTVVIVLATIWGTPRVDLSGFRVREAPIEREADHRDAEKALGAGVAGLGLCRAGQPPLIARSAGPTLAAYAVPYSEANSSRIWTFARPVIERHTAGPMKTNLSGCP
jgi:hypothetical protein